MKTLKNIAMISLFAAMISSCTVVTGTTTRTDYVDDLLCDASWDYGRQVVSERQLAQEVAMQNARQYDDYDSDSDVAYDYEDSYERRLRGFKSSNYRLPSSSVMLSYSDISWYTKIYDPAFYNIVISGSSVWVEPKYVTAMFGNWGASVVIGSSWGSPYWNHWSSYCYNPWHYSSYWWTPNYYYWGYNRPHYHYRPGYNRPHYPSYRPNYPHRPHKPSTPVYYGNRRVNSLGNISNSQLRRQNNVYAPSRSKSYSSEIETNRNVNFENNSGYSTSELINRRRNNKQNQPKVETRATNNTPQTPSSAFNQGGSRNTGSYSGGANRGGSHSGGGVNRGRR
jgi:hypothetical protein